MSKNLSYLSGRKGLEDSLFDRYGKLAEESGSPRKEDLKEVAEAFLMGSANTYGAISFYDFLKPGNQGKKVYVCNGSVCLCARTQEHLEQKLTAHFAEEEIGKMCCLGRCHENAAFQYKGKNYSGHDIEKIEEIIRDKAISYDTYHVGHLGTQVLTGAPLDVSKVTELLRLMLNQSPASVLTDIKASGLRGRGGAGFPIGMKLEFCSRESSEVKFIICNADEGDPGAYSDRYLLEEQPYSVLMGMMTAGYTAGASWGVVYIRGEYPESVEVIRKAIDALSNAGLTGKNILNTDFEFNFKVIEAKGSYICGEETALINSIEGQRPEVRIRPPFPAQRGLFQKPTVVNNVETLAVLPYILEYGGNKYASIGTEQSRGTKLVSLDSHFVQPGVFEIEMGTPLSKVFFEMGKGFRVPVKALHIGGPLGGMVPMSQIDDLTLDFESFRQHGFLLGHASVVSIPETMPFIKYLEHLFEFASDESCGKCFPCRLGTKRGQEMFKKAMEDNYSLNMQLLDDLLHSLEQGSLCAHGGGIPLPVRNILKHFEAELKPYFVN